MGAAVGFGHGEPEFEPAEDEALGAGEVDAEGFLDAPPAEVFEFAGAGDGAADMGGVNDEEAGVEADGGGDRGDGAAEIVEAMQGGGGAEGEAGFLVEFAGGGDAEGAGEFGGGGFFEARQDMGAERGGDLGRVVGRINGAAGEDEAVGHEFVLGAAHAHEHQGGIALQHEEAGGRAGDDGGGGFVGHAVGDSLCPGSRRGAGMARGGAWPVGPGWGMVGYRCTFGGLFMSYLHTMLRVGDLDRSVKFYTEIFGMTELRRRDVPEGKYTLVFLGFGAGGTELELTYNYGTEAYDVGTGFGHLAFGMPDVYGACDKMRAAGAKITREPGPVKFGTTVIAFVEDPDGYKIELIERK